MMNMALEGMMLAAALGGVIFAGNDRKCMGRSCGSDRAERPGQPDHCLLPT